MNRKIVPTIDVICNGVKSVVEISQGASYKPAESVGPYVGYDFGHRQPVRLIEMSMLQPYDKPLNIRVECSHDGKHWGRNGRQATWKVCGKWFRKMKYYRHKAITAARYWRVRGVTQPMHVREVTMYGESRYEGW